jgi:hypothetical protein
MAVSMAGLHRPSTKAKMQSRHNSRRHLASDPVVAFEAAIEQSCRGFKTQAKRQGCHNCYFERASYL